MAQATVTVTVTQTWKDANKIFHAVGTLSISANPATYVTGGLLLDLNDPMIKAQRTPIFFDVNSQNGSVYGFVPGSNNTNGSLKLFSALGTEVGNGTAIPAANSNDVISFHAQFLGMN